METTKRIDVNERVERACRYFKEGYNCAQAVAMAYNDIMEMTPEEVAYLNTYHKKVCDELSPYLEGEEKEWLKRQCSMVNIQ